MEIFMNIYFYRRLKNVNRLGCEPITRPYNLLEHSYMVTVLFCHFAKIEKIEYDHTVLEAIMHHDILETITGDLPYNVKNLTPSNQACWDAIESSVTIQYPQMLPYTDQSLRNTLNDEQYKLFKVCDMLDLWIFLQEERRLGNTSLPVAEILQTAKEHIQTKYKSVDDYVMFHYTF